MLTNTETSSQIIYNGAGLTLLHNDNKNYSLLMAKSNSNSANKKNVWIFAGGRRNEGELPHETAYREFIEEIFNVVVSKDIIDEIILSIKLDLKLMPINSRIGNTNVVPSYTYIQSSEAITTFVNILSKHKIYSDVFPYGYKHLYNKDNTINIYNFCSMRRYITEVAEFEKNELVFITMIPIQNMINSINSTKNRDIYHYHQENLKIYVVSSIRSVNKFINELEEKSKIENINILNLENLHL